MTTAQSYAERFPTAATPTRFFVILLIFQVFKNVN
jgi:hypothetical protein